MTANTNNLSSSPQHIDPLANNLINNIFNILPEVLWIGLILFIVVKFKMPITQLLSRLGSVKIGDMELQFVSHAFESIFKNAVAQGKWPAVKVSKQAQLLITNRINRSKGRIAGRKVLWVDDHPDNIETEVSLFKQLNVNVDCATSTKEAIEEIKKDSYDVVISDMARDLNKQAGLDMLKDFEESKIKLPVIFYVGNIQDSGTPPGAFGITNHPDELFHLFIDAVERTL